MTRQECRMGNDMKLYETTLTGKDLSAKAWKWWKGADARAYVDELGAYWIGASASESERFGTLEQVDAAFCEFQTEAEDGED